MKTRTTAAATTRSMTLKTGVRAGITPIPIPGAITLNVNLTSLSSTSLSSYSTTSSTASRS